MIIGLGVALVVTMPWCFCASPMMGLLRTWASIPTEAELRQRLTASGDLDMLVTWSREWLAQSDPPDHHPPPPHIQAAGVHWVARNDAGPNESAHVWIEFGGGFHHYGLLIGGPDFIPQPSSTHGALHKWSEGVWYRSDALE